MNGTTARNRDSGGGRRGHGPPRVRFPDSETSGHDHPEYRDDGGVFDAICGIATALIATVCVFGLMTILVVLYVTVRPFSQTAYRRLAAQLGAASLLDALALLLPNTKIYLTGDSDIPSPVGTSVLVCNHPVNGDWWGILMLARCVGLRGTVKVFMRNEYLHINMENVTVDQPSPTLSGRTSAELAMLSSSSRTVTGGRVAPNGASVSSRRRGQHAGQDVSIMAKLVHLFLEFPLINGEESVPEREQLFTSLRSFASGASSAPVQCLFFPEGWSVYSGTDRQSILARCNEFAQLEGKPQFKHVLLPRARQFNSTLECLRESSPVVYDVTMAYSGYDGSLPSSIQLSMTTLWDLLRRRFPKEIHIRVKRYSMEAVIQDPNWLVKKWAEKDRLLSAFARIQKFPVDSQGFVTRPRVFDTRWYSLEGSVVALLRLLLSPLAVPILALFLFPLFWTLALAHVAHRAFRLLFPVDDAGAQSGEGRPETPGAQGGQTPGSASAAGTPYLPATPFASPSVTNWRDMLSGDGSNK